MSTIKAIEFPDREFNSKEELFKALINDKDRILSIKKAQVKKSDSLRFAFVHVADNAIKSVNVPEGFVYAVINTTKYLDSHNDVHLNGIWNQSVKQQQGKIFFVVDHDISVKSVVAFPEDVEMMLKDIPFSDLGATFEGDTQALIFKVSKDKIQLDQAKAIIENKINIEHSVRMQYVTIKLGLNSDSEDMADEKAVWDNTISLIANKERALELGYFFAVSEAKIFKEGSMVLSGSNDVTPMLLSTKQKIEPSPDTHKTEPEKSTQRLKSIINQT